MKQKPDFGEILSILIDNCNKEFNKTKENDYQQEKKEKMDEDCKTMLAPSERTFVQECFGTICELEGAKTDFAYIQGMKDCVAILKAMEVL